MVRVSKFKDPYTDQEYTYNTISFSELEEKDINNFPTGKYKGRKKNKYLNIGAAFDIETTKIKDEHLSFMYIWQFSLNDLVIYGRTWEEFLEFLEILRSHYKLNSKRVLLVLVHNLSFEFQFIKKLIKWDKGRKGYAKIFALDPRKIIKAESAGIEFRDSLALTNTSLLKVAKDYKLAHQKLAGDLDYNLTRFFDSDLSEQELAYCFNDVLILSDFFNSYIKPSFIDKNIKIPLTSTGILRDELRRKFNKLAPPVKNKYLSRISKAFPSFEFYEILMNWVFRGGYVHSDPGLTDQTILFSLGSVDFKSAYPAAMLQESMPWEFVKALPEEWVKMLDGRITKNESFIGYFEISGIKSKGFISYESSNKILSYENAVWDNGRLWSADKIYVWLTEYDMKIYHDVYQIENIRCIELYKAIKEPLPQFLKDLILKYFVLKEETGKRDKGSVDYSLSKARLNSFYGMVCTGLYAESFSYNEDSGLIESIPNEKTYNELIENQILLPVWGIYTTSIIRYRLIHFGFCKLAENGKGQAIYGDTDSIKCLNIFENMYVFENFNNMIRRKNKTMYVGKYPREYFLNLGIFDFEEKIMKFKCLGAKRYLASYAVFNKKTKKYELKHVSTIAGMKKGTLEDYATYHEKDIYDCFKDGLLLDLNLSKKLTSIYNDSGFSMNYEGHYISEKSCVTLINIPFKLSLTEDYILLLEYIKKQNDNRLVKKRYVNMLY